MKLKLATLSNANYSGFIIESDIRCIAVVVGVDNDHMEFEVYGRKNDRWRKRLDKKVGRLVREACNDCDIWDLMYYVDDMKDEEGLDEKRKEMHELLEYYIVLFNENNPSLVSTEASINK